MTRQPAEDHLQLIERLRGGAAARIGYAQLRALLLELVERAAPAYWVHTPPRVLTVHRSRPLEQAEDWREFTQRDLGPPPPDKVKQYARCNRPGQSLLYCSLQENIALAEMQAARDQMHLLTTYLLDKKIRLLPIGELDFFRRTSGLTYLGDGAAKGARHYEGIVNEEEVAFIDAFFADEFMRHASTDAVYFLTSALADILFSETADWSPPDALFYPSVVFRGGVNFAIAPQAYASRVSLLPEETKIVRITEVLGYGLYRYETIARLESCEQDGLKWK
jgi:hypothetical protein